MIHIDNTTNTIYVPNRNKALINRVVLENNITKDKIELPISEIVMKNTMYVISLNYSLSATIGEYTYKLYDISGNLADSGLAVYGDYKKENMSIYNTKTNTIQYEG